MTAQVIYGHRRRDAMVAEAEARPFDIDVADDVEIHATEQVIDNNLIFTAVTLIRLMGYLV